MGAGRKKEYSRPVASGYHRQMLRAIWVLTLLVEAGGDQKLETRIQSSGAAEAKSQSAGAEKPQGSRYPHDWNVWPSASCTVERYDLLPTDFQQYGIVAAACAGVGGHQVCLITTIETGLGEEQPAIEPWLWICTPHEPDKWASSTGGWWGSAGDQVTRMLEEVCARVHYMESAKARAHMDASGLEYGVDIYGFHQQLAWLSRKELHGQVGIMKSCIRWQSVASCEAEHVRLAPRRTLPEMLG